MNIDELTGNNTLHEMAEKKTNFTSPSFVVEPHMLNARNQLMQTPLIIAVQQKFIGTVATLLELKPDLDCQDWKGNTALHYAVHRREREFAKLLVQHKARITIFNNFGKTALHVAAETGNYLILRELITGCRNIDID